MIKRALIIFVGILLLLVGAGYTLMGGDGFKPALNDFTFWHFLAGVLLGLLAVRARYTVLILTLWEFLEQLVIVPYGLFGMGPAELLTDSILDIICALVGYLVARYMIRGRL